jgi:hypothetical protein
VRDLGPVSEDEVRENFPDLFAALDADPAEVSYCVNCDGLRTHSTENCPYPFGNPCDECGGTHGGHFEGCSRIWWRTPDEDQISKEQK